MSEDEAILSEKLKTEHHLLGTFKITLIIGLLICGLLLYWLLGYFFRFTADAELDLRAFTIIFALITLFLVAPLGGIIVIANAFLLRKLHELELPKRHYTLPYISILINVIPAIISFALIFYLIFSAGT